MAMATAVLLSRAFSHALVHFRVLRPLFARRTKKKESLIIVVNIVFVSIAISCQRCKFQF